MTNSKLYPEVQPLRLEPSFGFGDRTGLATPGHVAAMREAGTGIQPIFPQQSIREMTRTGRTAQQVMDDAVLGMRAAGWTQITGADADHLKTPADIDVTFAAGFCFYTLDPSEFVDDEADRDSLETLDTKYAAVRDEVTWVDKYAGQTLQLPNGTSLSFTAEACRRAAVKYGRAIGHACKLAAYLAEIHRDVDREYEIELSVDETAQPTTLVEHYIIADQCLQQNIPLVSLAPRFPGDFEKGVDFKGDRDQLQQSLHDHAAIARLLGPYKLSLHSGSDKLSMYTWLAQATRGHFHVKTAGTSYLEALRVVARHADGLFREIIDFSRDRFDTDRATYHLSATLADVPRQQEIADARRLEQLYLEIWDDVPEGIGFTQPGRQLLHCTFGSVLTDAKLGGAI
ncbi:MAG: hypothetical protein KDB23_11360, partial [Planctomycetales bacterium]|nr:hypothetical protein [Planctomycetales bacterium]